MPGEENRIYYQKTFDVNIIKFIEQFTDENSCKEHLRNVREHQGIKCKRCCYFKMKVLKNHLSEEINTLAEESFDNLRCIVFSDKSTSYIDIAQYVEVHMTEKSTKESTVKNLPWVHIVISNAKRNFIRIYHKINGKYLQSYLDEFCYKLNRRYFGEKLFDRLAIAMSDNYWYNND